jgi:hypothetical protein
VRALVLWFLMFVLRERICCYVNTECHCDIHTECHRDTHTECHRDIHTECHRDIHTECHRDTPGLTVTMTFRIHNNVYI